MVGFRRGEEELIARAGERLTVPAGTPHRFWNAGDEEAQFVCEVCPTLQFEQLIETMFTLAAEGKTNHKRMPDPLRLAVIADAFGTVGLPSHPAWIQWLGLAMLTPFGWLIGYQPTYAIAQDPVRFRLAIGSSP